MYQVKELYYTLQGEGAQSGRPAVFCRFSGCNLWTGRESDRAEAKCWFCDTDFVGVDGPGGGKFGTADELADSIAACWPSSTHKAEKYVVFTGGEPLLQLDEELLMALRGRGFETGVETNGTIVAPSGLDWITVSPKPNSKLLQLSGNELKLVFPQEVLPESVGHLSFNYFYLSPRTTSNAEENRKHLLLAVDYCKKNPKWRLTMQYHRIWGIP